jgi:antitoxin MazE
MQTKLIKVGNSFGVRIPKGIVNQYNLEESDIEVVASEDGILLKPIAKIPPLSQWDALFKKAKENGFDAKGDLEQFEEWNNTLNDGEESL